MRASSTIQPANASSLYFGKIPSRGDFVKSGSGTQVIALIDNWVAKGMEMLSATPGWKSDYDDTAPRDFLFLSPRKRHAIYGTLIASADASNRRFPFITATLFEVEDALAFLSASPLVLERHANYQRALIQHAAKAHDAADTLSTLDGTNLAIEPALEKIAEGYQRYLGRTTIAGLTNALAIDAEHATVRQMVLSIGYLLQPILVNYAQAPQKGLTIPLPRDPVESALVKSLWLELISVFLARAEFELAVFSGIHHGTPKLIVTFNGAAPHAFHALFERQAALDYLIEADQAAWVDEYAAQDAAMYKLSSYLEHGELSLQQMVQTFRQSFAG
jgi:type VI secretion system protein ImpM